MTILIIGTHHMAFNHIDFYFEYKNGLTSEMYNKHNINKNHIYDYIMLQLN